MAVRIAHRLPGFRFEVQAPAPTDVLPRMDVALFVGFAQSGPLHTPVAVESVARFVDIFGDDLTLAWDKARGEPVYAFLAQAVRAFFQNGGRRCYVVRVAGRATSNQFPITGLLCYQTGELAPAFVQARSPGAWSDAIRVGASLLSEPLAVTAFVPDPLRVQIEVTRLALAPGDLLRLTFHTNGIVALLPVKTVEPVEAATMSSTSARRRLWITPGPVVWFRPTLDASPPLQVTKTWVFTPHASELAVSAELAVQRENQVLLRLTGDTATLAPGSMMRLDTTGGTVWLYAQEIRRGMATISPPGDGVEVSGPAWVYLPDPPPYLADPPSGERLTFELWQHAVRSLGPRAGETLRHLELGFTPDHPRFWGALPTDDELLGTGLNHADRLKWASLLSDADDPRFALAGGEDCAFSFPLGMETLATGFSGPLPSTQTQEQRNGLESFHAGLFLDARLTDVGMLDLATRADFLRYQSEPSVPLQGIYAAFDVEEATLIAVPDAVQRSWQPETEEPLPPPLPLSPPERPHWWHFLPCDPPRTIPRVSQPERGEFLACSVHKLQPSVLTVSPDALTGTFRLSWSTASDSGVRYSLMEATYPDFNDMVAIYTGIETEFMIYGRSPGDYYYTVRAEAGGEVSDWSVGCGVRVLALRRYVVPIAREGDQATKQGQARNEQILLDIHRALLRLCAARADLFALLALPSAYRTEEALSYVAALKSFGRELLVQQRSRGTISPSELQVRPLSPGEGGAFSYGALYHPWLYSTGTAGQDTQREPPDGAICGLLAQRALRRSAWIAPANEQLAGVVALTPPFGRADWEVVQAAQINLIRHEPRGFMPLSANTLSDDFDLRLIHVRRLLILLRRVALRLGASYIFEPNSPPFRRLVQQDFEALLNLMFTRGAFAGDRPETAYQVDVSSALNTPASVDQGRLIVELRVAPAQPLSFVTIRLVQTGDRGFVTEER